MSTKTTLRAQLKDKPTDETKLGFGQIFTDYMLSMEYDSENGWGEPEIVPNVPFEMDPANVSLHYGQLIFEGVKAYKTEAGKVVMFRPEMNVDRLNRSAERLCMPTIDKNTYLSALNDLIKLESDWIPTSKDTSLYIRPFMFANDNYVGVHPSSKYRFLTILSPVGSYYKEGLAPTKIYVEDEAVRAVKGGMGEAKGAGNYAASLMSQSKALEKGYSQVLWLDGVHRKYIEEFGTSNAFFVIDGKVVTPKLNGSILPGITRDSAITVFEHLGFEVQQRDIAIDELVELYDAGKVEEAFATGTAAVVSPIGELKYKEKVMIFNNNQTGKITQQLYDNLTGIQKEKLPDPFGWVFKVK